MRAPTAGRPPPAPEPEPPIQTSQAAEISWFSYGDTPPAQTIVLVTHDPGDEGSDVPARWYRRRQYVGGRWQLREIWVDPITMLPLDPQPTHWRHNPTLPLLGQEIEARPEPEMRKRRLAVPL